MKAAFVKDDVRYCFCFSDTGKDNYIYMSVSAVNLSWENVYKIPVIENSKYAYKINKKSVSAAGGAYGLMRYLKSCIDTDFCMVYVHNIINAITANMHALEVYTG